MNWVPSQPVPGTAAGYMTPAAPPSSAPLNTRTLASGGASSMMRIPPASALLLMVSMADTWKPYAPSTPAGAPRASSWKVKSPPSRKEGARVPFRKTPPSGTPVASAISAETGMGTAVRA